MNQPGNQLTSNRGRRAVLSCDQVINIFRLRNGTCSATGSMRGGVGATIVARFFGVSSKTVRDIWVGRTWYRATQHLDPLRDDASERLQKRPGRPKGAKDRKPRTRKFQAVDKDGKAKAESERRDGPLPADSSSGTIENSQPSPHLIGPGGIQPWQYHTNACCCGGTHLHQIDALNYPAQWPLSTAAHAGDLQSFLSRVDVQPSSSFEDPFHNDWAFWPAADASAAAI